jgi:glycosyltransferase involved in cell wall biosynthesis
MATTLHSASSQPAVASGDMLHVVYGVLSLEPGGVERIVVDLVRQCPERGLRATVVCVEQCGRLAADVQAVGGKVECLAKPSGRSPQTITKARQLLAQLKPDIIHTHQIGALWYLGRAASPAGIPVIHTEHSDHIAHSRGWLQKLKVWLMWRRASPLADRFCCVSGDIVRTIRRYGAVSKNKLEVVLNGIDLRPFDGPAVGSEIRTALGIPSGALVIGTVGRLVEVKRHDLLLRSFARLRAAGRHGSTWLLLVGDGPERKRLEELAASLRIGDRTVFAGYQSEPAWIYRAMDLFVLTSRHEGLPLALLEAWASGLPVVASAVGAIPQTLTHGANGMLFESGDEAALTETMEGLLDSPSSLGQFGRQGRELVERQYSFGRMAAEYEASYRQLADARARAGT